MLSLLPIFLFIPLSADKIERSQSVILPPIPSANSQVYLRSNNISSYSIQAGNRTSCKFKSSVIPCDCVLEVGNDYVLRDNDRVLWNFSVTAPDIKIILPTKHEQLQELNVAIESKLCNPAQYKIQLQYSTLESIPDVSTDWITIYSTNLTLHNKRYSLIIPCQYFADRGHYKLIAVTSTGFQIESSTIIVNETDTVGLRLRNDSIFPHCSSEFDVFWSLSKCPAANLQYRLRILAIPEGGLDHEDRAHYIEEIGIDRSQSKLSISCSQFDIIFEKYCFELVSVNKNSSIFALWQTICVSTEPVIRRDGGWSPWSDWSACSVSCGQGTQRRSRICNNPAPIRGKTCTGNLLEARECQSAKCPEAARIQQSSSNCTCGCELVPPSGIFYASASYHKSCFGNQTWHLRAGSNQLVVDFAVNAEPTAVGRLFFFRNSAYGELIWFSGSNQENAFTLSFTKPIFIVLWSRENHSMAVNDNDGFTVSYHIRPAEKPTQLTHNGGKVCDPLCPDTMVICILGVLFLLIIFIPPFICANFSIRIKRNSSPEVPLLNNHHNNNNNNNNNKYENEMMRSGNTECTHVSVVPNRAQMNGGPPCTKRSIGIQLSVQNTPRLTRTCPSVDSPLPRGQSSISNSGSLEYDYYDGTTIPGSLLAPLNDDTMFSEIDIDQIIGQSLLFTPRQNVQQQDANTQI